MKTKATTTLMVAVAIIALALMTAGIVIISKRPANNVPTSTITCSWEPIATPTPAPVATAEPTNAPIACLDADMDKLEEQLSYYRALERHFYTFFLYQYVQ